MNVYCFFVVIILDCCSVNCTLRKFFSCATVVSTKFGCLKANYVNTKIITRISKVLLRNELIAAYN